MCVFSNQNRNARVSESAVRPVRQERSWQAGCARPVWPSKSINQSPQGEISR